MSYCRSLLIIGLYFIISLLGGCRGDGESTSGKMLMEQYCGSCHSPAAADMLDRKTWMNSILPNMAPKLGVEVYQKQYFPNPETSIVTFEEWTKIVAYFEENAPEVIDAGGSSPQKNSDLFTVHKPQWDDSIHNIATTTLVAFNPFKKQIYTNDATTKRLYRWDKNLEPELVKALEEPGVGLSFIKDAASEQALHAVLTSIGTMQAVNAANGKLIDLHLENDSSTVIGEGLSRPVHAASGDFNKDDLRDWVVCAFGHDTGGLYLFEQEKKDQFTKKTIRSVPGAVEAKVGDFNNDGWQDIIALFAHGDEGIWLMMNDKKGGFTSKNLLRFPPVYGSTSFQLIDMNRDGQKDIIYTAGDNADYSQILKPYHGIYIFINQGDFTFEQEYFYHLNGATDAAAADFDADGDLDIAANAFFADLKNNPSESFVYLEQQKPLDFSAQTPEIHRLGRWLVMDVGDFEGDGDPDIVLGNYSRKFIHQKELTKNWNTRLPFILLSNNTRQRNKNRLTIQKGSFHLFMNNPG